MLEPLIQGKLGLAALRYPLGYLGCYAGKVKVDHNRAIATYNIISKQEVNVIIALFTKHKLNSSKYLNFLDFKQAFMVYNEPNRDRGLIFYLFLIPNYYT